MRKTLLLSKHFGKTILRERTIVFLIPTLPILLIFAGAASAPEGDLPMVLDDNVITPIPPAVEVLVTLYAITAVVLIASIVSFYLGFNLKKITPRLKQMNYSPFEIVMSFVLIMLVINIGMTFAVGLFSLLWIDVTNYLGFGLGLVLASIIFSTLGLIIAELVDTNTLGMYSILTLAIMDTAFLENPVYSRRYDENWISLMPSHESIQLVLRTVYDTGTHWSSNILYIIIYEVILILLYFIISKYQIGLDKT